MFDIAAISGALTSLKTASEIAKNLVGLRDASLVDEQILELRRQLSEAVEACLAVKLTQSAQIDRIRELEKEIVALKAWGAEKENYKLAEWKHGVMAYIPKECVHGAEASHALCAACYESGKKSVLQSTKVLFTHVTKCAGCKSEITTTGGY